MTETLYYRLKDILAGHEGNLSGEVESVITALIAEYELPSQSPHIRRESCPN